MNSDIATLGKRRLEELISFFGLNVEVEASETEEGLVLNIISAETGRLIGHHGEKDAALDSVSGEYDAQRSYD